jgi:hypothetical protein
LRYHAYSGCFLGKDIRSCICCYKDQGYKLREEKELEKERERGKERGKEREVKREVKREGKREGKGIGKREGEREKERERERKRERLFMFDSLTSTPQWIRQPKPRGVVYDVCVFVCKCLLGSPRASQPLNIRLCRF